MYILSSEQEIFLLQSELTNQNCESLINYQSQVLKQFFFRIPFLRECTEGVEINPESISQ